VQAGLISFQQAAKNFAEFSNTQSAGASNQWRKGKQRIAGADAFSQAGKNVKTLYLWRV
jgi:hypothetical protein